MRFRFSNEYIKITLDDGVDVNFTKSVAGEVGKILLDYSMQPANTTESAQTDN
jgi:hypothetical protein